MRVPSESLEDVMDELVPLLPQGVHERDLGEGETEVSFFGAPEALPDRELLRSAFGEAARDWQESEVPDDPHERKALFGRTWEIDGRLVVRGPGDPPNTRGLPEIVIEPVAGAFGTGAHPTTRMCLQILLDMEPAGGFADLGCGAGVLSVTAALLGFQPVFAVDYEPRSVAAAAGNAQRNGARVEAIELDLLAAPPPPAPTLAANVPLEVHEAIAPRLPEAVVHVIVSGIVLDQADAARALYQAAGLRMVESLGGAGWQCLLMERS